MGSQLHAFATIVIGSGIGGLTTPAALAKCGRRVLVVAQHLRLGGLTQGFERGGYAFAAGVHDIGDSVRCPDATASSVV
jgi:all-trans-retinol 13,14-reductase